jgi:hypothetical protein
MDFAYDTVVVNGTINTAVVVQYSDITSGIKSVMPAKPLAIFPNPASINTMVHMNADGLREGNASVYATDMTGKQVKAFTVEIKNANHKSIDLDMSDCPAGIYMIRLQQNDAVYSSRFIRQ